MVGSKPIFGFLADFNSRSREENAIDTASDDRVFTRRLAGPSRLLMEGVLLSDELVGKERYRIRVGEVRNLKRRLALVPVDAI